MSREESDVVIALFGALLLFIAMPWLLLHYFTKWRAQASLTAEDEKLLDELHEAARRLDERASTLERIVTDEDPNWRAYEADRPGLEDRNHRNRRN